MSAIAWGIAFIWLGVAAYLVVPLVVGPHLSLRWRRRIANHYFSIAMLTLDRALLIARKHGGYSLVPSTYDAGMEAEKVSIADEDMHFEDPYEFTTSLHKRRFGLADEERNVIINPRLAELGEEFYRFYQEGMHQIPLNVNDQQVDAFTSVFSIQKMPRMINLRAARWMIPGSASPKLAESVKDDIEKSQDPYKSRNYVDLMVGPIVMAISFGLVIAADYLVGVGGGGGTMPSVDVGLFIGVML